MRKIVKYNNRKLYDKTISRYVNISELLTSSLDSFVIVDYKNNSDVTTECLFNSLAMEQPKEIKIKVMNYLTFVLNR